MKSYPQIFAVLSHPRRFKILRALRGGPLTSWDLTERLGGGVSPGAMRMYLATLEDAGLISRIRSHGGNRWHLKKDALEGAISCLNQFTNTARRELTSVAFSERARYVLKNKKLLVNDRRQKILIEILRAPADVASLYDALKGEISKRFIFRVLSAFESEGLVSSRKLSRKGEARIRPILEFTATHFAQEVLDYSRAEITAGGEVTLPPAVALRPPVQQPKIGAGSCDMCPLGPEHYGDYSCTQALPSWQFVARIGRVIAYGILPIHAMT